MLVFLPQCRPLGTGGRGCGAAARLRLAQGRLGPGARPRLRHLGIARTT